jgi:serine/threonine-protein kinase
MSPEQCTGQPVDTRSDIYSYACVFYEALTGKPPIMGKNAVMTMMLKSSTKEK